MKRRNNIVFITGTDTGVGKTVMTGLLLHHLRTSGCHALAAKPFCSGNPADVILLRDLQDGELSMEEINPFYFSDPVAPGAARGAKRKKNINLKAVVDKVEKLASRCETLLVEGCGGLKVPLAGNLLLIDVIAELNCPVILVGPNKLGVLNHALLSIEALTSRGVKNIIVTLMQQEIPDVSSKTNVKTLGNLVPAVPIVSINWLGEDCDNPCSLKENAGNVKKVIASGRAQGMFRPSLTKALIRKKKSVDSGC